MYIHKLHIYQSYSLFCLYLSICMHAAAFMTCYIILTMSVMRILCYALRIAGSCTRSMYIRHIYFIHTHINITSNLYMHFN